MIARSLALVAALAAVHAQGGPFNQFIFPNAKGLAPFAASKFGLFIHWGPVSQWGTEISFPLVCTSFPCQTVSANNTPLTINNAAELAAHRSAYEQLATTFNPVNFNATALAELAWGAGFRYLTWVATHCDGFSSWNSAANHQYSIMNTPYGKDTLAMAQAAFGARGFRTGVYVCPSFWNNDAYWAPDHLTAFGNCCAPNYPPAANASVWNNFTAYLHEELTALGKQYSPTHFWIDSGTYTPAIDTHIEEVLPALRAANPEVVVQVRDGGVWHDYIEIPDHSEDDAHSLLGVSYLRPGDYWEVPGTLGQQWAYDPRAAYKDAPTVIRSLIGVIAKGGNYLLNIGLDPTGVWAPAAVTTLQNMTSWMAFNEEAIYNTTVVFPYEFVGDGAPFHTYFVQSTLRNSVYVFLVDDTGAAISADSVMTLPFYKPSTLASLPTAVWYLTANASGSGQPGLQPVQYAIDETGLTFVAGQVLQASPVALGTYFLNTSAVVAAGAPLPDWPITAWWRKRKGAAAGAAEITAAGLARRKQQFGGQVGATGASAAWWANGETEATSKGVGVGVHALADRAPCATRDCGVYTTDGYTFVRNEGVCYRSSYLPGGEPAVAVHLYYNNDADNMGAAAGAPPADGQTWQDVDVECWAYANAGSNRLPLQVWHSAALNEYWTLADPASVAEAQAAGYTLVSTLGYVDAMPASGLTPQEQAAIVASYAYTLRIDF